ncbi:MAG TPA: AMP-binding protein [Streptosporangiaceae bacterium]|jgi:cyclohexanecarboxylate-CoA ligase|nr:AMP-binding protein [Streptosporangiaceae bacterium]
MWDTLAPADPSRAATYYERGWWRKETFLDDLTRATAERPEAPAVIAYRNGTHDRTLTYRQLTEVVDRFAGALTELGVGPGDVVVVHLPNWWMLTPLYLACARVRAAVATAIPPFGGRELGEVLEMTQAKVAIVPDRYGGVEYGARLAQVAPPSVKHRVVVGDAQASSALDFATFFTGTPWERRHPVSEIAPPQSDEIAQVVFTSGTTGRPKGVAHSFNTMYAATRAFSDIYRLQAGDAILIPHYLTHLAGSAYSIWMSVVLGGTCVMQDTTDMGLLLDLVEAHGVTLVFGAPVYVMGMIAQQRARPRDISALRCLNTGSAPVPPQLVAQAREVLGLRLDSNFGMSECGAITITRESDPEGWAARSDGSPVDWMEVRVDAPPGEQVGRLLIRGASLCLGYISQQEAWAASTDSQGWFDTGDTARDDGRGGIRITGRRADLIVRSNGLMLPTLEVEAVLGDHPAVAEAVLIGYQDPAVPGADLACAMVVPDGDAPSLEELRRFLDAQQRSPRDWPDRIVTMPQLPRNAQGKVLRAVLRQELE